MSLGLCAPLLLAGQGLEPTRALRRPCPLREDKERKPSCTFGFLPTPGPSQPLWFGQSRLWCWLLVLECRSWGLLEASLSFHKGDKGLEEKGTSLQSQTGQPRGPVIVGPLVTVTSAHLWGIHAAFVFIFLVDTFLALGL